MLKELWQPAYALLVSLVGVGLAMLWLRVENGWLLAVVTSGVGIGAGYAALAVGKRILPAAPTKGRATMEWWILAPGTIAAASSALVIGITIAMTVPDGTEADVKTLITTISTAITSFVAAGFITTATKDPDSVVASAASSAFAQAFTTTWSKRFPNRASDVGQWATSTQAPGASGWGLAARTYRAEQIQAALD